MPTSTIRCWTPNYGVAFCVRGVLRISSPRRWVVAIVALLEHAQLVYIQHLFATTLDVLAKVLKMYSLYLHRS